MSKNGDAARILQEFQDGIRVVGQELSVRAAQIIAVELEREGVDPEFALKVIKELKGISGAEPEKKVDPYAGLATFQITFIGSSAQVAAQPMPVEVVEEVQPPRLQDVEDAQLVTFTPNPVSEVRPASAKSKKARKPKETPMPPSTNVHDDLMALLG